MPPPFRPILPGVAKGLNRYRGDFLSRLIDMAGLSRETGDAVMSFAMGATDPMALPKVKSAYQLLPKVKSAYQLWKSRIFGDASELGDPKLSQSLESAVLKYFDDTEGQPHDPLAPYRHVKDRKAVKALERLERKVSPETAAGEVSDAQRSMGGRKGLASESLESAVAKKIAKKTTSRAAITSVRDVHFEEAMRRVRAEEHLKQDPATGQYVGAPRGITNRRKLLRQRKLFDADVLAGEEGGDWYKRAQATVKEIAGNDPVKQSATARGLALTSSQANPETNLGFYLTGLEGASVGNPRAIVHTGKQAEKFNKAYATGEQIPLAAKTEPFAAKMDPTVGDGHIPVNDIWHLRALGFKNADGTPWSQGGTPQMHAYADGETLLAADRANARQLHGRTDWDAASVQAAPWVAGKGADLHKRFPKRFPTLEAGVREAAKEYGPWLDKYTLNATHEAVPGLGTGQHARLLEPGADAMRRDFSMDPRSSWADPTDGRDILYDAADSRVRKSTRSTGVYQATPDAPVEFNPAEVARPLVALTPSSRGPVLDPNSAQKANLVEAVRAYMDTQNAGAAHIVLPGKTPGTSLRVPMSRAATPDELSSLHGVAKKRGFWVSDTGDGITLGDDGGFPDARALGTALKKDGLADEIQAALPDASGEVRRVRTDGVYVDLKKELAQANAGKGMASTKLADILEGTPATLDKLDADPRLRQKARALIERADDWEPRAGPARADWRNAMEILASDGLKALVKAAREGKVALPAVIGVLGLSGYQAGAPTEDGTQ